MKTNSEKLLEKIIEGLQEKKGFNIIVMDTKHLRNPFSDYFVICSGNSDRQVQALSDSVEEFTRKKTKEKPAHIEGFKNGEWVLLDYINIVVHIFQPQIRSFYNLEELWGDAIINKIPD